jgi:hypothetical protein
MEERFSFAAAFYYCYNLSLLSCDFPYSKLCGLLRLKLSMALIVFSDEAEPSSPSHGHGKRSSARLLGSSLLFFLLVEDE